MEININHLEIFYQANELFKSTQYLEAIEFLIKAIDLEEKSCKAYLSKRKCLQNVNKTNEAIESFNKAIEMNSNILFNKGNTW